MIPGTLACIDVYPSSLMFGKYLSPNIVFRIPYPSDAGADGPAQHAETVCPFTYTTSSGLQQLPDVRIARESFIGTARHFGTSVEFNPSRTTSSLIGSRRCHCLGNRRHETPGARRVVDELKERIFKPPVEGKITRLESLRPKEMKSIRFL